MLELVIDHYVFLRFIPTCVGQMFILEREAVITTGSSPRAWGKCSTSPRTTRKHTVHPNVRGANCFISSMYSGANGSSPRAWGKSGHDDYPEQQ